MSAAGGLLSGLSKMLANLFGGSVAKWFAKALVGVGLGYVVNSYAMPNLMAFVKAQTSGMGTFVFQCFGAVGGDVVITMIISATVASVTGNAVLKALKK
ncbi:MAG: hypothetical protein EPN68_02150 [Rhodanobacter sp.]|nr:MAG: hypothetical protein EPN68_02150 [Rhodanobacter sp.]